jgi:glycosyltransferase involved in cell wall biosynthesis
MEKAQHVTSRKMVIITDTPMYVSQGKAMAFGPVVRELEFISKGFDGITWLGFDRSTDAGNPIFDEIKDPKIQIVPVKPIGGQGIWNKIGVVVAAPSLFIMIWRLLRGADIIHTRGPSTPAYLATLLAGIYGRKIWWNKYAGNWMQPNAPLLYRIQKKRLSGLGNTHVTINGFWPDQPSHCVSFENPCLYDKDLNEGLSIASSKEFEGEITCLFIGRLEKEKGVQRILDTLKSLNQSRIKTMHFVGDGLDRMKFEAQARELNLETHFHGFLAHADVHALLKKSHFLLLPSTASEGFPKVIAEAACYGCIPIVSDISSITHYVKHGQNGFVWPINGQDSFFEILDEAMHKSPLELREVARSGNTMAAKFGFTTFYEKLMETIFSNQN